MARFKYTDNSQGQFIAVNLKGQIILGTFEWTVSHIIDKTGMPLFEKNYRNDASGLRPAGAGCPPPKEAHPPALLLKAILFCPSRGIITPRKIERACKDNIITKALAEDLEPGRDTIALFISTNNEEVKDLFCQVLFKCSGLKLITGEMPATGGCKPPPDASKECSGKIEELKKKRDKLEKYIERVIKQHRELDKEEKARPHGAAAKRSKQFKKNNGGKERPQGEAAQKA
jgi:hypothetical protein